MTKAELAKKIAQETGIETVAVLAVVESFMHNVKESVTRGQKVYLRGFGTFGSKVRKEKPGRNITARTTVIIPEHSVPFFKPCDSFKESVKQ